MAKDYSIELGGQPRFLKYTLAERKELEKRFNQGLKDFIFEKVLPLDKEGVPSGGGIFEAQIAFLYAGIRHTKLPKKHDSERQVETWVEEFIHTPIPAEGDKPERRNHIVALLTPALMACLQSGVLGQEINLEDFSLDEESESDPKAPAP